MRRISSLAVAYLLSVVAVAQVLSPPEIKEPFQRRLQEQYLGDLKAIGTDVSAHKFPYRFYFSRVLDLEQDDQVRADQRSIRFARYNSQIVLQITGNYFASYSSELMDKHHRVRQTFNDVLLPILKVAAPHFANRDAFRAYALEISYHVRRKILGVSGESAENLVLILPRTAAEKLVNATTAEEQQAAVMEGAVYVDGEPFSLWLAGDELPDPPAVHPQKKTRARKDAADDDDRTEVASIEPTVGAANPAAPTVSEKLLFEPSIPIRTISPRDLDQLQSLHQPTLVKLVDALQPQAHFVAYAPPAFINFHNAAYLQLSMTTALDATAAGSRYKLAALAFDEHVDDLIRPVLSYFAENPGFEGVDFSTSVRLPGNGTAVAVEFLIPLKTLRCFAGYDCTGQQLINASFVLINGERVSLDLQAAEAERRN